MAQPIEEFSFVEVFVRPLQNAPALNLVVINLSFVGGAVVKVNNGSDLGSLSFDCFEDVSIDELDRVFIDCRGQRGENFVLNIHAAN